VRTAAGDRGVLGGHTFAVEGRQRLQPLADRDHVDVVCNRYNHTGQLRRGNSGEPVERPLQLVAPDRGDVYLDEHLADLERWRVDRFVAASTPGMRNRIASIVRGTATIGLNSLNGSDSSRKRAIRHEEP
jgi:hypothetical protein